MKKLGAAMIAATILAVAACSSGADTGTGTETGGNETTENQAEAHEIRTVFTADPSTFSPAKGVSADDEIPARLLFDTLIRRDDDGQFAGGLATEWEADASQAEFVIREGATCADGTAITPTVVAESLEYFASPETNSSYKGAVFGPGTPTITADDAAGTVNIELSEPWSDLINGLTLAFTGIICPAGIENEEGLAAGSEQGAFSGPYTLASAEHGVQYEFELRKDYSAWPEFSTPLQGVPADSISYTVVSEPGTIANQLSTGGMDFAVIRNRDIERFDSAEYEVQPIPFAAHYIMFNERESSVFADPELRKAVAQIVDREAFIQASTAGLGETFPSFMNPEMECALTTDDHLTSHDVAAGSQALQGVKIRFVGTQLVGPAGSGNTYLQEALRAAGAEVELQNLDNSTWATVITQEPDSWDLSIMVDLNVIGTVAAALGKVTGEAVENGGRNFTGSNNEEAVSNMQDAMIADTVEEKCALFEAAQLAVLDQHDVYPLGSGAAAAVTTTDYSVRAFNGVVDPATLRVIQ